MGHPRYAKGDPKEGQPVLVGDTIYDELGKPYTCVGMDDEGAVIVQWQQGSSVCGWALRFTYGFRSTPPAPAIEACVCGIEAAVTTEPYHVLCNACGRRGPTKATKAAAISAWNADMRKLKAK